MKKRLTSILLACCMTISVILPNSIVYAKGYVVGIDANGNSVSNVQNLTGDSLGGEGWTLALDCAPEEEWTLDINQQGSWLKLTDDGKKAKSSGIGPRRFKTNLKENNTANDRSATIIFDCGDRGEEYIYVYQNGSKAAIASSKNLTVSGDSGDGDDIEIQAGTGVQWKLTENYSWLSLSSTSGKGYATITPRFKANSSNRYRVATIKLQYKYKGRWKSAGSIKVKQSNESENY